MSSKNRNRKHHRSRGRHHRRRRPRSVLAAAAAQDRKLARAPHSFVFARPGSGSLVKALSLDVRRVFEPFTASQLRVSRRNVLKDFISVAGPLHVSHILYFTHPRSDKVEAKKIRHAANAEKRNKLRRSVDGGAESEEDDEAGRETGGKSLGGVYLHLIRSPSGPSLTFRVSEYSLTRDIVTLVRKSFDIRQFSTPPLLAMTGFGGGKTASAPPPPHLRLLVDMFQNMLPPLNVQKLKVSSVRRVLLLSREVDSCGGEGAEDREVIYLRHYNIRLENRSISRALRRLGMGGAPLRRQRRTAPTGGLGPQGFGKTSGVPDLAHYANLDDYLTKANLLTDSAASEVEDMAEVTLPGQPAVDDTCMEEQRQPVTGGKIKSKELMEEREKAKSTHGFTHLSGCRKACVRLTELGPRLTLELIKIEEGVNSGVVLYHSWQKRTPQEVAQQDALLRAKEAVRAQRRAEHERRRLANEVASLNDNASEKDERGTEEKGETEEEEEDEEDNTDEPTIHQLSDTEDSRTLPEPKRKKTKKKRKISSKHPAFAYLMQKAKERRMKRVRKH